MFKVGQFEFADDDFAGAVAELAGDLSAEEFAVKIEPQWGSVVRSARAMAAKEGSDLFTSHIADAVAKGSQVEFIKSFS